MVAMRVTVLGAGVTGLTTASRLLTAGCWVRVVAAAPIEESTSYLAAAVWFPTHVGPADRVAVWGGTPTTCWPSRLLAEYRVW